MYKELSSLTQENDEIRKENARIKEEYELIKTDMEVLKERMDSLEKGKRKLNVVLTGMEVEVHRPEDLRPVMEEFIEQRLEVKTSVKTAINLESKTCLISFKQLYDKISCHAQKRDTKIECRVVKNDSIYITVKGEEKRNRRTTSISAYQVDGEL
ncbi:hypothetical protein QE152_g32631 [Popillia japonica]|uniref:Uncharacterized protein n=1 Tax=Popillia japonica TaxID=7064 RepID=A0AAW1IY64_POPJA